jgi:general secretion pathway protein G
LIEIPSSIWVRNRLPLRLLPLLGSALFGSVIFVGVFMHPPRDIDRVRQLAANIEIHKLVSALEGYIADCGKYPSATEGLDALTHDTGVSGYRGPYLKNDVATDPWGRRFQYRFNQLPPEVISYGADGKPGGEFFDTDISSQSRWTLSPPSPAEVRNQRIMLTIWFSACAGFIWCLYLLVRPANGRRHFH